jgi:hypothetical protein
MNLAFVSVLNAETTERALDKKARVVTPSQGKSEPGDADDIGGNTKLDFQQENNGNGNHSRSSKYSINPGNNMNERDQRSIFLIFFRFVVERALFY